MQRIHGGEIRGVRETGDIGIARRIHSDGPGAVQAVAAQVGAEPDDRVDDQRTRAVVARHAKADRTIPEKTKASLDL